MLNEWVTAVPVYGYIMKRELCSFSDIHCNCTASANN